MGQNSLFPHGCGNIFGFTGLGLTGFLSIGGTQEKRCECTSTTTDLVDDFQSNEGLDPKEKQNHLSTHVAVGLGGVPPTARAATGLSTTSSRGTICLQGTIHYRECSVNGEPQLVPSLTAPQGGAALPTGHPEQLFPGFLAHEQEGPKPLAAPLPQSAVIPIGAAVTPALSLPLAQAGQSPPPPSSHLGNVWIGSTAEFPPPLRLALQSQEWRYGG